MGLRSALVGIGAAVAVQAVGLNYGETNLLQPITASPSPSPAAALQASPSPAPIKLNGTLIEATELAKTLFADDSQPCLFLCDSKKVQETEEEKGYATSTLASDCPEFVNKTEWAESFDLESVMLPAGMRLLVFGHSYLWEQFHFIRAAHKILGRQASADYLYGNYKGMGLAICAGHGRNAGMPFCGGTDPGDALEQNCDDPAVMRYTFTNGATMTGVMNEPKLQDAAYAIQRLPEFLAVGKFTHALVMEPHAHAFFADATTLTLETDLKYGCGWSDTFWQIMNAAFAGKSMLHLTPWGISEANLTTSAYAPSKANTIPLSTLALSCTAEAPRDNLGHLYTTDKRPAGHQCTAVRDKTGYYLGPIPFMTKKSVAAISAATPLPAIKDDTFDVTVKERPFDVYKPHSAQMHPTSKQEAKKPEP